MAILELYQPLSKHALSYDQHFLNYGTNILAPAVGLVLLALLAKGECTHGRTNMALYVYR